MEHPADNLILMRQNHLDLNLDGYVDWVIFDRSWSTFSEPCSTEKEARELADRTGGGPVFKRQWVQEGS